MYCNFDHMKRTRNALSLNAAYTLYRSCTYKHLSYWQCASLR